MVWTLRTPGLVLTGTSCSGLTGVTGKLPS